MGDLIEFLSGKHVVSLSQLHISFFLLSVFFLIIIIIFEQGIHFKLNTAVRNQATWCVPLCSEHSSSGPSGTSYWTHLSLNLITLTSPIFFY
jgi:hypothetical protein